VEEQCRKAVEFMRQGNYESSIECYKEALNLDPDYLPALNNLAIVYEKQPSWHNLAIENWNRVLELSRQRNDEKHMDRAERHLADLTK
jgi:tetratricopeptide (TPR) repeat protein